MRKKILSIILTLCMLAGLCQFSMAVSADVSVSMVSVSPTSVSFTVSGSPLSWAAVYPANDTTYNPGGKADWINCASAGTYKFPSGAADRYQGGLTHPNGEWTLPDGDWKVVIFGDGTYANIVAECTFTVKAPEKADIFEYYVKKDGTGDGRSAETPAGTIAEVVNSINADAHTADETVTVYVMDSGEAAKTVIDSDCVIGYNNTGVGQVPSHKATIKYTSYDENVTSLLGHVKYQGSASNAAHLLVAGPSIFENIDILDMRNSNNGGTDLYMGNHPVTFKNVKFKDLKGANQGTMGEIFAPSSTHFSLGQTRGNKVVNGDQYVYLDNANIIGDYASITGYSDAGRTQGINGNVTFEIGSGTLKNLYISLSKATETVTGNCNIVLGAGAKINRLLAQKDSSSLVLIVNGALQIVKNYGATVPAGHTAAAHSDSTRASNAPYYELTSMDAGLTINVTDTAGEFEVTTDKIAYAVSEDGRTIYYGDELLKVAPGVYEIYTAESIDDIVESAEEPNHTVAYRFDGWDRTVSGKITAILTYVGTEGAAYYVMNGGTGNGLTPTAPIGSVAEAIKAINLAGYTTGDEVTVYIMDAVEQPYLYDAEGNSVVGVNFYKNDKYTKATTWRNGESEPEAWTATITFTSYDYATTNKMTHLMWHAKYGININLRIKGPAVFKDLALINPRKYDREYFINGFDVTFENVKFYHINYDFHSNAGNYDGKLYEGHLNLMLTDCTGTAASAGGTVTLKTPFNATAGYPYGVYMGGTYANTFTNPVTVNLADSGITTDIFWGTKAINFNGGLNLIVDGATVKSFTNKDGTIAISDFQLISYVENGVFDLALPSNAVITGGKWNIKVNSNYMFIQPTETAGTYTVDDGMYAVAGCEATGATYISKDGLLTVPEGTYTVTSVPASELEALKINVTFDGEASDNTYLKGYSVVLPDKEDTLFAEFLGWELDGETYAGGSVYTIPEDSGNLVFTSKWAGFGDTALIFIDAAAGSDSNDGSSAEKAVATLAKAVSIANAKTETTKKLVIIGELEVSGAMPKNTTSIIITGDGTGNSVFDLYDDCIFATGEITFENLEFTHTTKGGGKVFCTDDYHVTFGEGLTVDKKFIVRVGGYEHSKVGAVSATFKSGVFPTVEIGHFWMTNRVTVPSATIVVDGAAITNMLFTSNSWSKDHKGCDYSGPVKVTLLSGSIASLNVTAETDNATLYTKFNDTVQVIIGNGATTAVEKDFAAEKGAWILKVAASEECSIEYGNVAGTFKVNGDKTALATNVETNAQYASTNGVLTLAEGTYNIDFVDMVYYINDGEKITVYSDCNLDLSVIKHTEKAGKEFIGWADENGNGCALNSAYKAGDVLYAKYVDYAAYDKETGTGDFFIKGAQIRTSGIQGLRFIVEKKNAFANALPNVAEFGTLVLPTEATWGRDMFIGQQQVTEWTWDTETKLNFTPKSYNGYTPSKVVGEKLYAKTSDGVQYTLCITGIDEEKYYRYYTVKGYIKYTDLNGIDRVFYSDYYQTNLYQVALAALEAGEDATATFEGIKEYVEVDRKAKYMAENYDNRKLLSGYPTTADTDPNHAMYQLANGFKVREVEIDSGKGGDEVEIVHFADTHLNYINQKDMDLGEINTLSTYRGRSWLRNGSSVPNISTAMEYASFFDKAVITGDVMDYFSWGCAEIMQKMIVDQSHGKVLMAMGNHEPAERMQADMSGLSDKYTLDQRYATLQEVWTNDIKYHSEIVTNDEGTEKVMIVILDNQRDLYWGDEQAVPFAADIEKARSKGIPILIFEHDPIATLNPAETAATYFYEVGDGSGLPCDMTKRFAGSPSKSDADTMKVYNLIVQNPDVIKGVFCGHWHNHMYTEILAQNSDGSFMTDSNGDYVVIPQHVVTANAYAKGAAIKITVK